MYIIFVWEVFIDKKRHRTIIMMGYKLVAEMRVTSKVVAYWKVEIGDSWEVIIDENCVIEIKCGNSISGIYLRKSICTRKVGGGKRERVSCLYSICHGQ